VPARLFHAASASALWFVLALAHSQPLPARVEVAGDAVIFDGRIEGRSAAQFLAAIRDPAITRVVITSHGGLVTPALDMAEAIYARQLDVEVPDACLSSCANYIFPAARRKRLGHERAVGWHGNMTHVLFLQQTGQASWGEPAMDEARQLARREAEFYRRIGVDGFVCWFAKIAPYEVPDFYSLRAQDMARFGIRDVTLREDDIAGHKDEPAMVDVQWERLEADRPAVAAEP
jgi:hypothetical protein